MADADRESAAEPASEAAEERADDAKPERRSKWRRRLRSWAFDIVLLAGVYLAISAWQRRDHLDAAAPAPAFSLRDLDGNVVTLESFRGKSLLVHFWATWCGVCKREFGALNAVQEELGEDEALVSIVSDAENPEAIRSFVRANDIRYPVLLGTDEVLRAFRVSAYPTNYFVTPVGTIDDSNRGMSSRWGLATRLGCAK